MLASDFGDVAVFERQYEYVKPPRGEQRPEQFVDDFDGLLHSMPDKRGSLGKRVSVKYNDLTQVSDIARFGRSTWSVGRFTVVKVLDIINVQHVLNVFAALFSALVSEHDELLFLFV